MGSGACSCLVAVGCYAVIVSMAFVVVTILCSLDSSDYTGVTADNAESIKKLVHYDVLYYDNSRNGCETVEKVEKDEDAHMVICNCGRGFLHSLR